MAVNVRLWLAGPVEPIDSQVRAARAELLNQRDPVMIAFTVPRINNLDGTVTPETTLPAQPVRIAVDDRPTLIQGPAGMTAILMATVFGVRGHPDPAVLDTDIDEGYTFTWGNDKFRVTDIILNRGEVQATARAIG